MAKRILILILIYLFSLKVFASESIGDIWKNNQAVKHLEQQKAIDAYEEFSQLLSEQPFNPLFQFNMGASFIAVEEKEKAIKMFEEILKQTTQSPVVEFATHYNLGVLYGSDKNIDKALSSYQKALSINPNSKEVKTNIELLLQGSKGGGGGGGKGDDKNKQKQEQQEGDQDQEQQPKEFTNKPQPGQFDGKEMSKSDVNKILEELKKQEQNIRAKHERQGGKEAEGDKPW